MSPKKNMKPIELPYSGNALLEVPLLNKGSAFTDEERKKFRLSGLLPQNVETIEEQVTRVYGQYSQIRPDLEKHIFLRNLQDTNETLFYRLVSTHLKEILPIIYTPVVGEACVHFSSIYRANRGLFISYPNRDHIDEMLSNVTKRNVKIIVVTDGERILGLGDQGIGGMGIPIGKLSLYTACGGVSPAYTLPLVLDVGTNNQQLLNDPLYMGWRHPRITGEEYEEFVDKFIKAVKKKWPEAIVQFEDFALKNALPLLNKYRDEICCFNDDIQGTAAVALGSLISASKTVGKQLKDQKIVILGAGSAGCGIAENIIAFMKKEGLSESEARSKLFMVDRFGLITDQMTNLLDFQAKLAQKQSNISSWAKEGENSLLETVRNIHPTIMIGVSGQPGLFTEEVIKAMYAHCKRPIIMPLSNPTSRVEVQPEDAIRWTEGNALIATGSPFMPVEYHGKTYPIAQCNNSYIFPGLGLGALATKAKKITDNMLMASSEALADITIKTRTNNEALLPDLEDIEKVSREIALRVGKAASVDGVTAKLSDQQILDAIEENFWYPVYREYIPREI